MVGIPRYVDNRHADVIKVPKEKVQDVVDAAEELNTCFREMYSAWVIRQSKLGLTQEEIYVAKMNGLHNLSADVVLEAPAPWPSIEALLS